MGKNIGIITDAKWLQSCKLKHTKIRFGFSFFLKNGKKAICSSSHPEVFYVKDFCLQLYQVLSCELYKILQNIFSSEHLQALASNMLF